MKDLNFEELKKINGGVATFAYRVGQLIRGLFMCVTPVGMCEFFGEDYVNEQLSN